MSWVMRRHDWFKNEFVSKRILSAWLYCTSTCVDISLSPRPATHSPEVVAASRVRAVNSSDAKERTLGWSSSSHLRQGHHRSRLCRQCTLRKCARSSHGRDLHLFGLERLVGRGRFPEELASRVQEAAHRQQQQRRRRRAIGAGSRDGALAGSLAGERCGYIAPRAQRPALSLVVLVLIVLGLGVPSWPRRGRLHHDSIRVRKTARAEDERLERPRDARLRGGAQTARERGLRSQAVRYRCSSLQRCDRAPLHPYALESYHCDLSYFPEFS